LLEVGAKPRGGLRIDRERVAAAALARYAQRVITVDLYEGCGGNGTVAAMNGIQTALRSLARQEQFLDLVVRDPATARFHRHIELRPLGAETVPLSQALGRVLACAVIADVDVPGFDRASVDGFAVHADDTLGATERAPKALALNGEILTPGTVPQLTVAPGTATLIATGGMVPRGADAVIMVEHTETRDDDGAMVIEVRRTVAAGQFIAFAGSDLARGETVLRLGQVLTSREIGMLAAVGCAAVEVDRRRDCRAGEADPPRRGLRFERCNPRRCHRGSRRERAAARHRTGRRDHVVASRPRGACRMRLGDSFGRHFERCRRSVPSRHLLV
jgi:hypothetical protein